MLTSCTPCAERIHAVDSSVNICSSCMSPLLDVMTLTVKLSPRFVRCLLLRLHHSRCTHAKARCVTVLRHFRTLYQLQGSQRCQTHKCYLAFNEKYLFTTVINICYYTTSFSVKLCANPLQTELADLSFVQHVRFSSKY